MAGPLAGLSAGLASIGASTGLGITGGDLFSGALSFIGGRSSAKSAKRQANRALDLQEMQLRHGHEIAVKDMREAGLNPILAAGNPAASSFSAGPVPQDTITPAVSTAMASRAARLAAQNTEADTKLKTSQGYTSDTQGALNVQQHKNVKEQNELLKIQQDIARAQASSAKSQARVDNVNAEIADAGIPYVNATVNMIEKAIGSVSNAKGLIKGTNSFGSKLPIKGGR